ncbi:hypothetical protein ACSTLI_23370, partial [Vibrio parahaemolyticus]
TKLVVSAARDITSQKTFIPMTLLLLFFAFCVAWSQTFSMLPSTGLTAAIQAFFLKLHNSIGFLWNKPLNVFAAEEMKWVLLFDLTA